MQINDNAFDLVKDMCGGRCGRIKNPGPQKIIQTHEFDGKNN